MRQNSKYILNNIDKLLTIIILTKNEEIHITRAIKSAQKITSNVYVIDSDSTDETASLVLKLGAKLFNASFDRFSDKLNWCINVLDINTPWVLRLDADEYIDNKHVQVLFNSLFNIDNEVSGIYLRRQLWFMNQHIKFGGLYPNYSLRMWRNKSVICESRELDEHLILKYGTSLKIKADIIDNPLTSISHWVSKHNNYSKLEANNIMFGSIDRIERQIDDNLFGKSPERKRWFKNKLYNKMPLFIRPFGYYIYRYIFLLGFLDGIPGFLYHFYHAFWYRLLIDSVIFEKKMLSNK